MVKSKLQKFINIFNKNSTILRLFEEFGVDFKLIQKELFNDVLFPSDEVIQNNTVLALAENPEQSGEKEEFLITTRSDNSGDLNETWINIYSMNKHYYFWFNVDSTGSDPEPDNPYPSVYYQIPVEINITENESSESIAQKISNSLDSYEDFTSQFYTTYQNVPAVPEVTNVTFLDDLINGNSNYSSNYFKIYNGTDPYIIWFDIGGGSTEPSVTGTKVKVTINDDDNENVIAEKTANEINSLAEFVSINYTDNIDIEANTPGACNDAEEQSAINVVNISILSQGTNAYTQTISKIEAKSNLDGDLRNPGNSVINSPDFSFTITKSGEDDPIAVLNEGVSTTLGLYPLKIEAPHEEHYKSYLSTEGTTYTYLLKWIYFTYKYFNEEQFFFKNLLEHYVPEYDSNVISSINNLKIYFDGLGIVLDTIDQKIENLYTLGNIDEIDDSYLQHMAQLLGYQKEDFSIKNISFRELIKNLVEIYQRKGTSYSFELFFKLLGFNAKLKEYYWDRDAKNPEGFASITNYNYLYYLTTQNPSTRTKSQYENVEDVISIQPIRTEDWALPKDLRKFEDLQSEYNLDEILGFSNSDLPKEERFTYFKTNYINFELSQFYTKQDLTAKDTETILKYVKFLTPIYVSAFVEVVTTPWEDTFEWSNPLSDDVIIEGDPGTPNWVDILLPFLFVTLKEYIPLNLEPASEESVVVTQHGSTDNTGDGFADDALPIMWGYPAHGITIQSDVIIGSSELDLSTDKYFNLKLDKGRGTKVTLQGNTITTYNQLINRLNFKFSSLGINAEALAYGVTPNIDIRIRSNTTGSSSKIYLANGLTNDLFTSLHNTVENPVNGSTGVNGYQEFGLTLSDVNNPTGLTPSKDYNFYINVNDHEFTEIDVSGSTPSTTTLNEMINSINNHYFHEDVIEFIGSANVEYLETKVLNNGKIAIAFRDVSTNNGKLIITNLDGSIHKAGINFSRFDCRDITITPSIDNDMQKFFLSYYDISTNQLKWTVMNNEGEKEINDRVLEDSISGVEELKATTLENNKVVLAYTTNNPASAWFRIFDLEFVTEDTQTSGRIAWYNSEIRDINITSNNSGFVTTGNVGTGIGQLLYFNEDAEFLIGNNPALSTKTFTSSGQEIAESVPIKYDDKIFIFYNSNKSTTGSEDYRAYATAYKDGSESTAQHVAPYITVDEDVELIKAGLTSNNKAILVYLGFDKSVNYKVYNFDGELLKKKTKIYENSEIKGIGSDISSNGDLIVTTGTISSGYYIRNNYLGETATGTFDGRIELNSVSAGATWDDSVENYAAASDRGHRFTMDDSEYVYDNYSSYLRTQGVDFTRERNSYNTFYNTSPNDDLIPLIEDSMQLFFTLLIGTNTLPADNVDKVGFYLNRAGYISRSRNQEVKGSNSKGYYLRHQDFSDDIRQDQYRVMREIKWPQWKKDRFDKSKEKTKIIFNNNGSDYSGKYFIIYSGLTRAGVWYDTGDSVKPSLERTLLVRVVINETDNSNVIATKTRNALLNHPALSFDIQINSNEIIIDSNIEGETNDGQSGTLSGIINISIENQGESSLSYKDWSSWTMSLDNFKATINYDVPIIGSGGVNIKGSAYPSGIYKEFTYGAPNVTAGVWQIDGDPTGTAIIEFIITDPDPLVVWTPDDKVSYVDDNTGKWVYLENSNLSVDGKTLSAEVDHFSTWGVMNKTTKEIVSDDYSVDINVSDAKVTGIKEITNGPTGNTFFGGSGYPYGRYEEFTAPVIITPINVTGESEVVTGQVFIAPMPTGGITITGESITDYGNVYFYISSGIIEVRGSAVRYIEVILESIITPITFGGSGIYKFNEFSYAPAGEVIISGSPLYEYMPFYIAPRPYGWISTDGIAIEIINKIYDYEGSGSINISGQAAAKIFVITTTTGVINTSGSAESHVVFERMANSIPIIFRTPYVLVVVTTIFDMEGELTIGGEAEYEVEYEYESSGGMATAGEAEYEVEYEYESSGKIKLFLYKIETEFSLERESIVELIISGNANIIITTDTTVIVTEIGAPKLKITGSSDVDYIDITTFLWGGVSLTSPLFEKLYSIEISRTATPTSINISGEVRLLPEITWEGTGSIILRDSALLGKLDLINLIGEGILIATKGNANMGLLTPTDTIFNYNPKMARILFTGGSGGNQVDIMSSTSGDRAIVMAGPDNIRTETLDIIFQVEEEAINILGTSNIEMDHVYGGSGGLTINGETTVDSLILINRNINGFAIYHGTTSFEIEVIFEGTSGININGDSSDYTIEFEALPSGGMTISGDSPFEIEVILEGSNGIITSGSSPFEIEVIFEGTSGININGNSSNYTIEFEILPSGSMTTSGSSPFEIEVIEEMTGSMTTSGSSPFEIEVIEEMTGSIIISGNATYSVE